MFESPIFAPHPITWTKEKAQRIWRYLGSKPTASQEYFSNIAGQALLARACRYFQLGSKVLDFGCGAGHLMGKIMEAGATCFGADFSSETVAMVKRHFQGQKLFGGVFLVNSLPLPLPDGCMDTIFSLETLEHLLPDQLGPTVEEWFRLLRPGGHLVVTTPNSEPFDANQVMCPDCGAIFHPWQHVRSFRPAELRHLINSVGFRCLACRPEIFSAWPKWMVHAYVLYKWWRRAPLPHLAYFGEKPREVRK